MQTVAARANVRTEKGPGPSTNVITAGAPRAARCVTSVCPIAGSLVANGDSTRVVC
jgi:hypothetical protein